MQPYTRSSNENTRKIPSKLGKITIHKKVHTHTNNRINNIHGFGEKLNDQHHLHVTNSCKERKHHKL